MHIYPTRQTRHYWTIPLHSFHECNNTCVHRIQFNVEGTLEITPNPHYNPDTNTCERHNMLYYANVPIHSYQFHLPRSIEGRLHNVDTPVIPDTEFSLFITFPMTTMVEVYLKMEHPLTLRELLEVVRQIYTQIYQDEERTAEPVVYEYMDECVCVQRNFRDFLETLRTPPPSPIQECSICFSEMDIDSVRLSCNHFFHPSCILEWTQKGKGYKCPLCRSILLDCRECHNTQQVQRQEEYVVIPNHLRDSELERNHTNGLYGIYGHDLENLYLTHLRYNHLMKLLQLTIFI